MMVLYTIMHHDDIYPSKTTPPELKSYAGKQCYVMNNNDGSYEIVQLLSTNPQDFLEGKFQPGTIIKYE